MALRCAFISDIHGNFTALEAVLDDIAGQNVDRIYCLGDIASIGPEPVACLERIRCLGCATIQGNHELYMCGMIDDPAWPTCPTWWPMRWSIGQIDAGHEGFMANLPLQIPLETETMPTLLVHASPHSQFIGFLPWHNDEEITLRMAGVDGHVILCGHTHQVLFRSWRNNLIVNVGSVGLPVDGRPAAQYVIGTETPGAGWGWQFEFRFVAYDLQKLETAFARSGLNDVDNPVMQRFKAQMFNGKPVAGHYIRRLRRESKEQGVPIAQLIAAEKEGVG